MDNISNLSIERFGPIVKVLQTWRGQYEKKKSTVSVPTVLARSELYFK